MGDLQDFFEFIDVLEEEQQNEDEFNAWRLPKRYIRDMQDPFDFYENSARSCSFTELFLIPTAIQDGDATSAIPKTSRLADEPPPFYSSEVG